MQAKNWQISVAIVCVVLGFLLIVQVRTQNVKNQMPSARSEHLVELYKESEDQRKELQAEVASLRKELSKAAGTSLPAAVNTELVKARIQAGVIGVRGPGIVLTLDDSTVKAQPGQKTELFLIHDEDLLTIINELNAAGAEAISINGQRHVASTEVRCAGPTTSVNKVRVGTPFMIKAIGDPEALQNVLLLRGGVLSVLKAWGIRIKLERATSQYIPPYRGSLNFTYARPSEEGE